MCGHSAHMDTLGEYCFMKVFLVSSEMGLDIYEELGISEGTGYRLCVIGEDLLHLI